VFPTTSAPRRNVGGAAVATFTVGALALGGALVKPWCPDTVCRDTAAALSENKVPSPNDRPTGVYVGPYSMAGGTVLSSASTEATVFRSSALT
jgi:hypothetical protein